MINPTTYEGYGESLFFSAEKVTLAIGSGLLFIWKRAIENPDSIYSYEGDFIELSSQQANEWDTSWKGWVSDELANAYLKGVLHTDKEIEQLKKKMNVSNPTSEMSAVIPMLKRRPSSTKSNLPKGTRDKFKKYPHHLTFYEAFRGAAYEGFEGTHLQIIRQSRDELRNVAIVAGESTFKEADTFTRIKLAQSQLDDFAKRGLQAITYRDGRRVPLDTYAEMVGRTMSGHAAIQASLNRYEQYGYDLVRVTSHFRACPMCTPWEGQILSQSGDDDRYPALQEAIDDGLFHPNCAHDINPYFEGLSPEQEIRVDPAERALIDEYGYEQAQRMTYDAQQRQREIERNIRTWKRRETTSLTKDNKVVSLDKVREWQKKQREHLAKNPFLPRKYVREQIKKAH